MYGLANLYNSKLLNIALQIQIVYTKEKLYYVKQGNISCNMTNKTNFFIKILERTLKQIKVI